MTNNPRVVVIDCNRNGLAAIRSFGKAGIQVVGVDHFRKRAGRFSKYVTNTHLVIQPHVDVDKFITQIAVIGEKYSGKSKPFLLPVNDEYVRTLAANWDKLEPFFEPLFETNVPMLDKITNKLNFSDFCRSIGIPQPRRYTSDDVRNDIVDYPIIYKPDERRSLENISERVFKIKVCSNAVEGLRFLEEVENNGIEVIIQKFVPGGDDQLYTGGVAAYKGELLGCFTGKKVRQFPPSAGQASWAVSVESEKLVAYSKHIVKQLGFTGIAQIEFKSYKDELYVIEMNPRSWSWHSLAQSSGVNLPILVYNAAFETRTTNSQLVTNKKNGLYWHYFIEDVIYNVLINKNIGVKALVSSARKASGYAFFDKQDIRPWLVHLIIDYPIRFAQLLLKGR